jgi:hypothetical protein
VGLDSSILKVDLLMIESLRERLRNAPNKSNKALEFYYWEGVSPGPLLSWTVLDGEKIALGLWLHLKGATDHTPYIVATAGPLFESLRSHVKALVEEAKNHPI